MLNINHDNTVLNLGDNFSLLVHIVPVNWPIISRFSNLPHVRECECTWKRLTSVCTYGIEWVESCKYIILYSRLIIHFGQCWKMCFFVRDWNLRDETIFNTSTNTPLQQCYSLYSTYIYHNMDIWKTNSYVFARGPLNVYYIYKLYIPA